MNRTAQHPLIRASNLLVHCFARKAAEWQQVDGGKWRSSGGRVLSNEAYQRHQRRLTDREKLPVGSKHVPASALKGLVNRGSGTAQGHFPEALPAETGPEAPKAVRVKKGRAGGAAPKPAAGRIELGAHLPGYAGPPPGLGPTKGLQPGEASDAANRAAHARARAGGQTLGPYAADVDYTRPVKAPALPGGQKLPDPSPADSAYINAQHGKDTQRFGAKVANFLRSATAGAVGILTATNGLAWGAIVGTALGGPLGLALGTAIGGGIGGRLGAWAGKKVLTASQGKGRLTAMARGAAQKVLPKVAGGAVAGIGTVGAAAMGATVPMAGATIAGPVGAALGSVLGIGAGMEAGRSAGKAGVAAVKGTRALLARSPAAKRRAARDNKRLAFADSAPGAAPANLDPVALIKARVRALLARQGQPADIPIDDEPILAALALAAQGEDAQAQGAAVAQMSEPVRRLLATSRRLRRA